MYSKNVSYDKQSVIFISVSRPEGAKNSRYLLGLQELFLMFTVVRDQT